MLRPSLAAGLGVAAVCGSVATVAITSGGAHAATRVPVTGLPGFGQVVVDSAANRVFVSEGTNASSSVSKTPAQGIVVADLSGNYLTTIDAGTGAQGLTLGPDGQLYAALSSAGEVAQIDPATYSETDYPLPAGYIPQYVAAQSGKVWVSYQKGPTSLGFIGDITPGTMSSFQDSTLTSPIWIVAPLLAADPSNGGTVVAVTPNIEPPTVASLDVSGATPAVIAENGFFTTCTSGAWQAAVLPGGEQFTMSCGSDTTPSDPVFSTTDLSVQSAGYPALSGGAVAVAPDGAVATGGTADAGPGTYPDVDVFSPGSTAPAQSYSEREFGVWDVATRGLAWGDSTVLAVVMAAPKVLYSDPYNYQLRVITDPLLNQSAVAMNSLKPEPLGTAISVSGSLTINGAAAAGKTVTISRSAAGGSPVQLGQATTDSSGAFTISDTPPAVGSYTYTASFAGDSATDGDTTTGTVSVLNASRVTLQLPPTVTVNHSFDVTGVLTINGAPAAGRTVTIRGTGGTACPPPPTGSATATPIPISTQSSPAGSPVPSVSPSCSGGTPHPTVTPSMSPSSPGGSPGPTPSPAPVQSSAAGSPVPAATMTACPPLQSCGGTTVTIQQAVTNSDGVFTVSDTPPAPGTYTYTVSFDGDSATAPATATGTVVSYPDQLVLQMPSTALPNQTFDASGWLTFASGASADGKTVTITRNNPDGTATTITAATGTKGSFSFRDDPPADGTYTYTATYADSTGTVTAKTSTTVTVAKES